MKREMIKTAMIIISLSAGSSFVTSAAPIKNEFRFEQIKDAESVCINKGSIIREKQDEDSQAVGEAKEKSKAYILEDISDEWVYIESGKVRGFLKKKNLTGRDSMRDIYQQKVFGGFEEAEPLVLPYQNEAFTYTKTTVKKTIVEKKPAIAKKDLVVYETKDFQESREVGSMKAGTVSYILADDYCEVMYVESGDVRGFVDKSDFITGKEANDIIKESEENPILLADKTVEPQENTACYYTLTSTVKARTEEEVRSEMVDFALQFVGNPYMWGGTSLTDGADCSGFVQSIYSHFGYAIPRVTTEQAGCGVRIAVSEANPGDLIFYEQPNGYIYHVSMYIGDGKVVQAANSNSGIITSGIWDDAVCAVRIIE